MSAAEEVRRWVVIGDSLYTHLRVRIPAVGVGHPVGDVHLAACGYDYQASFERSVPADTVLTRCPRCLAVAARDGLVAEVSP